MSHETRLATEFKVDERECLVNGLRDLGFTVELDTGSRQYGGQTIQAPIVVRLGRYDVAFVDNGDGTYQMSCDQWGLAREFDAGGAIKELFGASCPDNIAEALMKRIKGAYNERRVREAFKKAGLFNVRRTAQGGKVTIQGGAR